MALTKEQGKASVILVASDYAFPLGLQALGFNKYDALNTIVAPEVEEKPMFFCCKSGVCLKTWHRSYEQLCTVFFQTLLLLAHARAKQGRILVFFGWVDFL